MELHLSSSIGAVNHVDQDDIGSERLHHFLLHRVGVFFFIEVEQHLLSLLLLQFDLCEMVQVDEVHPQFCLHQRNPHICIICFLGEIHEGRQGPEELVASEIVLKVD